MLCLYCPVAMHLPSLNVSHLQLPCSCQQVCIKCYSRAGIRDESPFPEVMAGISKQCAVKP